MPLAGLILNRTHPTLCDLHAEKADDAAEDSRKTDPERWRPRCCGSTPTGR